MATAESWYYLDRNGEEFGPYPTEKMQAWFSQDVFPIGGRLLVRLATWQDHVAVETLYPNKDAIFVGLPSKMRQPQALSDQVSKRKQRNRSRTPPPTHAVPSSAPPGRNARSQGRERSPPDDRAQPAGYGPAPHYYPPAPAPGYGHPPPSGPPPGYNPYGPPPEYPQYGPPPGYGALPGYGPPPGYPPPGYGPPPGYPPYGYPPLGYGQLLGYGSRPGDGPPPLPGVPPGQYLGLIKSFSAEKGYGFIDCPEARAKYGRDVFIHKKQVGDLQIGMEITFKIEISKEGHPQARGTTKFGDRYVRCEDPPPKGKGKGSGKGKGEGKGEGKKNRRDKKKPKAKASPGHAPGAEGDAPAAAAGDAEAPEGAGDSKAAEAPANDKEGDSKVDDAA